MIQLFDVYNQETQDLHDSLVAAALSCPTIVIEPNGFLPDDMLSPFLYFLGERDKEKKARYYNQIEVPRFWSIVGDSYGARIFNLDEEKGRIHYAEGKLDRVVTRVDWLDRYGNCCLVDHYDKYGYRFAQTTYHTNQQAIHTTYFSDENHERLVENHVTGDIILSLENEPIYNFKNRRDFVCFFLKRLNFNIDHILFNSLSVSFLVSHVLPLEGKDILFWQEPIYDDIPGNMQLILQENHLRTQTIVIPNSSTYEKVCQMVSPAYRHKLLPLGYHYSFKRDNFLRKDALILTHSDQIEQLEVLVQALPEVTFRIAALTEMSPKLLAMLAYPNVVLYQNVSPQQIEEIFQISDLYLDINYGGQVLKSIRKAFENNLLILAFKQTIHDNRYIAPQHVFDSSQTSDLIHCIKNSLETVDNMRTALLKQGKYADDIPLEHYQKMLHSLLGGK